MTPQAKTFRHYLVEHDLRVHDFYDLIRRGGVVISDKSAKALLMGEAKTIKNRAGVEYNFNILMSAADRALKKRKENDRSNNEICGMWKRLSKNDVEYIGTYLHKAHVEKMITAMKAGRVKMMIWPKKEKTSHSQPDFDLLLMEP